MILNIITFAKSKNPKGPSLACGNYTKLMNPKHAVRKCKHILTFQFVYMKYCLKDIEFHPGLSLTSQQISYYISGSLGYYMLFSIRLHSAYILLDAIYNRSYTRGSHSRDYVKFSCLLCFLCHPQRIHNKNNHNCQHT